MWTRTRAIAYLKQTVRTLEAQSDLSPGNPIVTDRLRELVATLKTWQADDFGSDLADEPELAEARETLPQLCAAAERAMEKWWCRKALASGTPERVLADFWYLANYLSLCRAETALVGGERLREAVFLGFGALPLSAILLAQADERARLTCVDADSEACELADALVRALGLEQRIRLEHVRAECCGVPRGATVICASLLDAPRLHAHLAACRVQRILIRDVEGVYQWLYRPAALPGPAFHECARTASAPERINITHLFESAAPMSGIAALAADIDDAQMLS